MTDAELRAELENLRQLLASQQQVLERLLGHAQPPPLPAQYWTGGWTCSMCGMFVITGFAHTCSNRWVAC